MAQTLRAVLLIGICASPVLVHSAYWLGWSPALPAAVLFVQVLALLGAFLTHTRLPGKGLAVALAIGAVTWVAWRFGTTGITMSAGVPHAVAHLTLLTLFTTSVLPGREPLVATFIRQVRGSLPNELARYGRHATIAWCAFFAAQLALSLGLFLFAPLAFWSFFVNVLNLPLVLLMFSVEFVYHTVRFRHLPRSRLTDIIRIIAIRRTGLGDGSEKTASLQ